jgi:ethanolamine ammonia-lyase small subunit
MNGRLPSCRPRQRRTSRGPSCAGSPRRGSRCRSGASLATGPLLEFRLAHARARDAVHAPFDAPGLCAELAPLGLPVLAVASAAQDRQEYLTIRYRNT